MIDEAQRRRHAARSLRLALVAVGLVIILAIIVPLAAPVLNGYSFLRFPLGLFLATQGTVIGILAVIYWSSGRQERLDRKHGLSSEL